MSHSDLEITTLVENMAYRQGTKGEHGLSFMITTHDKQILFDTGQSDLLLSNAQQLGIDLSRVDCVVISHGHYDHTGGLESFFRVNQHAPVYAKPAAFETKYSKSTGQVRPIGMQPDLFAAFRDRFHFIQEKKEIASGLWIVPSIASHYSFEQPSSKMLVERDGKTIPDDFSDELFLFFDHPKGLTILSGCSHRGVLNICQTALDLATHKSIRMLLGGTHLKGASSGKVEQTLKAFEAFQIQQFGLCHCTGLTPFMAFKQKYGEQVRYAYVGTRFLPYS